MYTRLRRRGAPEGGAGRAGPEDGGHAAAARGAPVADAWHAAGGAGSEALCQGRRARGRAHARAERAPGGGRQAGRAAGGQGGCFPCGDVLCYTRSHLSRHCLNALLASASRKPAVSAYCEKSVSQASNKQLALCHKTHCNPVSFPLIARGRSIEEQDGEEY